MSGEIPFPVRRVDNDAPERMRVELLNAIFGLADATGLGPTERELYNAVTGCLGVNAPVNPYRTLCGQAARYLCGVEWQRTYDVVLRLSPEFLNCGRIDEFRRVVNTILAAHGVVWDVSPDGRLARVLPIQALAQVEALVHELDAPDLHAARQLFGAAQDAFNAIPRRDRDACANAFDAMESVGRTRFGGATFGDVLTNLQKSNRVERSTLSVLRRLEATRHNHFGHGNAQPFGLRAAEVEFIYLSCIGGTLLLARV